MSYFLLCISVLLVILVMMIMMKSKKYNRKSSMKSSCKCCNRLRQTSNSLSQKPRYHEYYDTRSDIANLQRKGIKLGTIQRAKDTAQPPPRNPKN